MPKCIILILNSNTGWEKCIHSHPIEKKNIKKAGARKCFPPSTTPKTIWGFFFLFWSVCEQFQPHRWVFMSTSPSSRLCCNFQVFVVKITHLLLAHPTSGRCCGHRAKQSSAPNRLFWLLYPSPTNDPAF